MTMRKKAMKNPSRREAKLLKERTLLIKAAMNNGALTKSDIKDATGLEIFMINDVFKKDRELYSNYVVRRKTIMDVAADNIHAIANDKNHPQHFQASKYLLEKFKSDFDDTLDSHDTDLALDITSPGAGSPVTIKFSSKKKETDGGE